MNLRKFLTVPRKKILCKVLLLSGSLTIALGISEIVCALLMPSLYVKTDILGRKIMNRPGPRYYTLQEGEQCYHDFLPRQEGRTQLLSSYDVTWKINSLSLRNVELNPAADYRLLVLGDSQTFGIGVDQEKTFCAQLASLLSTSLQKKVEVLNAGVPGYGTWEALWKWKRLSEKIKPHLVISVVFVDNALVCNNTGNDLCNNWIRTQPKSSASPDQSDIPWLADHSHLYALLSRVKRWEKTYLQAVQEYQRHHKESKESQQIWQLTCKLLQEIEQLARTSAGARTLVFYLPGLSSLELGDSSALQELQQSGLPLVSIFDELLSIRQQKGLSALCFPHDAHYNEEIHRRIAQKLQNFILDNGFLPRGY